jgi:TolA-binding protein
MPLRSRHSSLLLLLAGFLSALPCVAQQAPAPGSSSRVPGLNPTQVPSPSAPPSEQKLSTAPALIDPAGPDVSLETSEAMFDMGVALNACGYDRGLDQSEPVRKTVRDQVNEAVKASPEAADDRDKLCLFIDQHRAEDPARNLAQYVSLALYLTPPPALTPNVEEQDLPPDANGVELILPLVRRFAADIDLHHIWAENHPAYDELANKLHTPLSQMIVATNYYLRMPASSYSGRHFLVVIEPLFSPLETNARVYGSDYVVIASPQNGQIPMDLVRHAYLHYEIEPLLYQRANSMDRLMPILRAVDDAPLEFEFKSDIVALVIECMIRAIEARTMNTGIPDVHVPSDLPHSETQQYEQARTAAQQRQEAARQRVVAHDMTQGYVLTQYFYNQLRGFEKSPESLSEAIGPMVYGMDVSIESHRAQQITFDAHGEGDIMRRSPQRPPQPKELDVAELKLMKGDVAGATQIAQKALATHTGDPGQANFILARADLMNGRMDDAVAAFRSTIAANPGPRLVAWSHIYMGRIFDVKDQRQDAVAEYRAALASRDGQPDTKEAAEAGIKKPFELPQHEEAPDGGDDNQGSAKPPSSPPQPQ